MANKVWVQQSDGAGNYACVIHTPTPAGNNSAGVSWVNALVAAGLNTTVLTVGVNGWQQSQAEHDAVVAGTVIELAVTLPIDSAHATAANVTQLADAAISDYTAKLARMLAWFGYNQAA